MSEFLPAHDADDSSTVLTVELSNAESLVVSPHNTALFEFTGSAASRDHIFFFGLTDDGDLVSSYLFRTFDPSTYDELRQRILADSDYEIRTSDTVEPCEERAYQRQIDQEVDRWRQAIPDTAVELLITTAR